MAATEDFVLPSYEELTVQELDIPFHVFLAAGRFMAKKCINECNEYLLCKAETQNPRTCLNYGKSVTACGVNFMMDIKKHCREEVEGLAHCIASTSSGWESTKCRDYERTMDGCIMENLDVKKPPPNYFMYGRTQETDRPRRQLWIPDFENESKRLGKHDYPRESRHGPKTIWGR